MQTSTSLNKLKSLSGWQQTALVGPAGWLLGFVFVLLAGLANPVAAQGGATRFTNEFITISGSRGNNPVQNITTTKYYTQRTEGTSTKAFNGQDLGEGVAFNRNSQRIDYLFINAEANTYSKSGDNIQSTQLLYRVYRNPEQNELPDTNDGSPIPLNLPLDSSTPGTEPGSVLSKWARLDNKTNLINFATIPGTYTVEVSFEAALTSDASSNTVSFVDDNSGNFYKATFKVAVYDTPYTSLQWDPQDGGDKNWFNPANWAQAGNPGHNRIPDEFTDVTIPYGDDVAVEINSGAASVHNLTLISDLDDPNPILNRLSLNGGNLYIYGDFQDLSGGFAQASDGFLTLAGTTQAFDASVKSVFKNLTVTGGDIKTVTRVLNISGFLNFLAKPDGGAAGILATGSANTGNYAVILTSNNAYIAGETENAYISGSVNATREVFAGVPNYFGNIGLDLKVDTNLGNVTIIRTSSSFNYVGVNKSVSIKRGFRLIPDNVNPVNADIAFHYLDGSLNGIANTNLRLFSTTNGRIPFTALDRTTIDTKNKVLVRNGIAGKLATIFTLGSVLNPLPVTLTSFTATATPQGGALLRWTTANETNNRGFNIERQVGAEGSWTTIGFVAAGSTTGSAYEYADKTLASAPASDKAYYRLRQEDLDGKTSYSPVAAITRQSAVAATELTLSPVPVSGSTLTLTMAEIGQAGIEVAIINTQGQRLTNFTTQASTEAALNLPVGSLAPGVYIVSVRVPGQATRHARFVKL